MEERTKKILEFLEPYGSGEYHNISPLLNEFFPVSDLHDHGQIRITSQKVWDFVYGIRHSKVIRLRDKDIVGLGSGNISGGFAWLNTITIDAAIEPEGELQLALERAKAEENELRSSTLITNIAVQRMTNLTETNIKSQIRLTKTALWIAGVSGFIALAGLFKDCAKADKPPVIQLQLPDSILKNREKRIEPFPSTPPKTGGSGKDSLFGNDTTSLKPKK